MSREKKKYVAPKYEMVIFDSQIMTGFASGCWGVIGVEYDESTKEMSADTCHTTTGNYPDIWPIEPSYSD